MEHATTCVKLVTTCIKLVNFIYQHCKLVQVNKAKCATLADRIMQLHGPLQRLQQHLGSRDADLGALQRLEQTLMDARSFVQKWILVTETKPVTLLRQAREAYNISAEISSLHNRLEQAQRDLHLQLTLDLSVSAAQRDDDNKKDFIDLQNKLECLLEDNFNLLEARDIARHQELCDLLVGHRSDPKNKGFVGFCEINHSDLTYFNDGALGSGSYGVVTKAAYCHVPVAVKTLHQDIRLGRSDLAKLRKEVELHAKLNFPHVVQLLGACTVHPTKLCMVMELAPLGSLYNVLRNTQQDKALSWELKVAVMYDVTRAVHYLHQQEVLHCDLKSPNVLIFDNYCAKVCDFGLAKLSTLTSTTSARGQPVGTYNWMAPEIMEGDNQTKFTAAADVYSTGMVMYEILSGEVPFKGKSERQLWRAVPAGDRPPIPQLTDHGSQQLTSLMQKCWAQDQYQRPSIQSVCGAMRETLDSIGGDSRGQYCRPSGTLSPISTTQSAFVRPEPAARSSTACTASPGPCSFLLTDGGSNSTFGTTRMQERQDGIAATSSDTVVSSWPGDAESRSSRGANHPPATSQHQAALQRFRDAVSAQDGATAVTLMCALLGNAEVQKQGAQLLANLAGSDVAASTKLGAAGAGETVIAGLRAHLGDAGMQQEGIRAVGSLACNNANNQRLLGAAGGCEAVAAGMRAHAGNAELQGFGILAVHNLACNNGTNKAKLAAVEAHAAILAAMSAHSEDTGVQQRSMLAIANLADDTVFNNANRTMLGTAGACEAVVAGMRAHLMNVDVQQVGVIAVAALSGFMVCHDTNCRKLGTAGACEAVVAGMRAHPDHAALQRISAAAVTKLVKLWRKRLELLGVTVVKPPFLLPYVKIDGKKVKLLEWPSFAGGR